MERARPYYEHSARKGHYGQLTNAGLRSRFTRHKATPLGTARAIHHRCHRAPVPGRREGCAMVIGLGAIVVVVIVVAIIVSRLRD